VDELLSIGRFARQSGLTIEALRHYDELGVLKPAVVDPVTGYRRYRHGQLDHARQAAWLRSLDVPLDQVRRWLDPDTTAAVRSGILRAHLADVEARLAHHARVAHRLRVAIDEPEDPMAVRSPITLEADERRQLAADLFNHTWELLAMTARTPDQDDEMIHAAHASRYHWGEVGSPANRARGEWQCSRAYAVLGRAEPALHHARRCLAICEEHDLRDWDLAAAWEALARATRVAGDDAAHREAMAGGRAALEGIGDPEDRRLIEADLDELEGAAA
jgi:DNA-binding transcriptional MerR regulator